MSLSINIDRNRTERVLLGLGDRMLRRRAERIAALARVYAANNGSIAEGIQVVPDGFNSYKIISTNPHTLLVHNGSRPHPIFPRKRGGYLRFEVDGQVVYARKVNHPGYKGNPFLTDAMRDAR